MFTYYIDSKNLHTDFIDQFSNSINTISIPEQQINQKHDKWKNINNNQSSFERASDRGGRPSVHFHHEGVHHRRCARWTSDPRPALSLVHNN